jgi:ketosteroid isomerase-like protein
MSRDPAPTTGNAGPSTSLVLRCFVCGTHRQVDDDGRRVRLAKAHVAACSGGPGPDAESHLSLVSGDRLEVRLANGTVWFEIARGELAEAPPTPEEAIARFYREWYAAVVTGPEGFAAAFARDGALLPPDAAPVLGRDAIRAWRAEQSGAAVRIVPESATRDQIRVVGDAAFVRTTVRGQRVSRATGEAVTFEDKYLDLLRRTASGWEFVARMWNSNPRNA